MARAELGPRGGCCAGRVCGWPWVCALCMRLVDWGTGRLSHLQTAPARRLASQQLLLVGSAALLSMRSALLGTPPPHGSSTSPPLAEENASQPAQHAVACGSARGGTAVTWPYQHAGQAQPLTGMTRPLWPVGLWQRPAQGLPHRAISCLGDLRRRPRLRRCCRASCPALPSCPALLCRACSACRASCPALPRQRRSVNLSIASCPALPAAARLLAAAPSPALPRPYHESWPL